MKTADYVIYTIWILIPVFYFLSVLWAKLENLSGRSGREDVGDYFKQGVFVTFCVVVSYFIDQYLLKSMVDATVGDLIPFLYFRIMLLPVVLYVGARLWGPTKQIRIEKIQTIKPKKRRKKR